MALPVLPLVEMVRFEVATLAPGVTESVLKLQADFEGLFPQERVTALPKAEFTEETVTVMVPVVVPLVVEMLVGETATEKSGGAGPTLATNPSARPPPKAVCKVPAVASPVLLVVLPARYASLLESTAMAPNGVEVTGRTFSVRLPDSWSRQGSRYY